MAIRITCKACKTALSFEDDKAGKKVRCRKCEEVLALPAAPAKKKREDDEAISEKPRVKLKARPRDDDDDDEDDRPRKKKGKAKQSSSGMLLAVGGAVLGLVMLLSGGSLAAYFVFRKPTPDRLAKVEDNREKDVAPPVVQPPPENNKPADKVTPKPAVDPNAGKPLPDKLSDDTLTRVKQATVYIRVVLPNGQMGSGSGFLALEPELIFTNAHVVGMLQPNAPPPRQIEVFLNSGQANELKMIGQLLGVDRASDLAVVRVNNKNLPPPLPVDAERKLTELQKVFIFGFPFGEQLGKAITVSESSISSFRPDSKGELNRIQVQGGIQPGNSGGPVVNSHGSVIGVAVSIIQGTQINFAVPAVKIHRAMEGRVSETHLEQAILENGQTKLPIKVMCLDPLRKITQMKVDVWTGMPGQTRPGSSQAPPSLPGDGMRQTHTVTYQNGVGTLDVPLPPPNPGQVYWIQPMVTNAVGNQWGEAVSMPGNLYPIERKPANLALDFNKVKERTVKLKSFQSYVLTKGGEKKILGDRVDVEMLEAVLPDPVGFKVRTCYGPNMNLSGDIDGKIQNSNKQGVDIFRQMPPIFMLDPAGKFKSHRADREPPMPPALKDDILENFAQACNSIEAVMIPMPNRQMNPLETWPANAPLPMRTLGPLGKKKWETFNINLTCTFEGVRTRDQKSEGVVSVKGKVLGTGINAKKSAGEVSGLVALDIDGGFISSGQLKIVNDLDTGSSDVTVTQVFQIDLTREAGNTLNLQMPPESKASPNSVPGGKLVFQQKGQMLQNDPADPIIFQQSKKKTHYKIFPVKLEANKTYVISLNSNAFDSYLRLHNAAGPVAMDDNGGGGKNARITYRPQQDGFFQIVAISNDGKTGAFELTVHEMP